MTEPRFATKVIAFIDILGFKQMVAKATDADLPELLALVGLLGKPLDIADFAHGPLVCPASRHDHRYLDFSVTQVSDCVIVSAERTPAGVINLISYCDHIAVRLMQRGHLCRGSIVIGPIYHKGTAIIGEGYQRAYASEGAVTAFSTPGLDLSGGGPFIEVAPEVLRYIADETDDCVRKMFARITHSDSSTTAIYPFHAMAESHFTTVDENFDPRKWHESISKWRALWIKQREDLARQSDASPPKVQAKFAHVVKGMDHIIERADDRIRQLDHMLMTGRLPREGSVWGML